MIVISINIILLRHQDLNTKKQHIPLVDRAPLEPPPIIVAIVGPPKVGKTTLIKCLIRNFTRQPLSSIKGPITVISGIVFVAFLYFFFHEIDKIYYL